MSSHRRSSSSPANATAAVLLGAATGLRSQIAVAGLVLGLAPDRLPGPLHSAAARPVAAAAALGELAVDKYPKAPPRTAPPGLISRLALGGLTGGIVNRSSPVGRSSRVGVVAGAALGAGAAAATTFGGLSLRVRLARRFPSLAVALAEDAVAIGLVSLALLALTDR
jgi:uncharacterized membrane protein